MFLLQKEMHFHILYTVYKKKLLDFLGLSSLKNGITFRAVGKTSIIVTLLPLLKFKSTVQFSSQKLKHH